MTTTTDIAKKTAVRIGIIAPDETLEAQDESSLKSSLTNMHEALIDDNVIRWELDAIPGKAVGALISELAWYVRDDFDLPVAKIQSLQLSQVEARKTLNRQYMIPYNGEAAEVSYY
mgnify:CR=1 FL=1